MLRLIGALLLLAGLAGGALYFGSDVFRPRMNEAFDAWTKWTPDNIVKDPKGYLTFALTELEKIEGQLKAHRLGLQVEQDKMVNRLKAEQMSATARANVLDGLKDTFRVGAKTFPVSVEGKSLDEVAFQERVVEVDRELEAARENVTRLERHGKHLDEEIARTEREMKRLAEKRQFVQQKLDHLKLDLAVGISDELTSKADEIASTAKAIGAEGSKAKQEAVELIKAEERRLQGQSVKERFEQIMASK